MVAASQVALKNDSPMELSESVGSTKNQGRYDEKIRTASYSTPGHLSYSKFTFYNQ
jgi:hypothetical protein